MRAREKSCEPHDGLSTPKTLWWGNPPGRSSVRAFALASTIRNYSGVFEVSRDMDSASIMHALVGECRTMSLPYLNAACCTRLQPYTVHVFTSAWSMYCVGIHSPSSRTPTAILKTMRPDNQSNQIYSSTVWPWAGRDAPWRHRCFNAEVRGTEVIRSLAGQSYALWWVNKPKDLLNPMYLLLKGIVTKHVIQR